MTHASATTSAWSDTVFPSMGSTARILILGGPPDLPELGRRRLDALEARWSRFRPSSELCRINAACGAPVMVSRETFDLIALAVISWRATAGHFDPTVIDALERAGYDRTFDAIGEHPRVGIASEADPAPSPGCADIELLPLVPAVQLPPGVRLDLGGIGKGRAADLLHAELRNAGAEGACVNLGGDVRMSGASPDGPGWRVDLDPALVPGRAFRLGDGAVATSTRVRRRWTVGGDDGPAGSRHHLIDPRAGGPAWSGLAAVTVLAPTAAEAEVVAKAAFVAGPDAGADIVAEHGATGLFLHDDGRPEALPGLDPYLT